MLLFLVVALLLVLSLVAVFFLNSHNEQGEIARIYQDGKLIREVSLTDVASRHQRCRLPGQNLPAERHGVGYRISGHLPAPQAGYSN